MTFYGVDGKKVPEIQPIRNDGTRICPYNKSHKIRAEKWDLHLMKCRENHPDSGIVICKFVYGHHISKEKIEEHEKECYEEHFCNGNKTPLNDKTFIIPNPLRNHSNGSVSSSDPEWEEEVQIKDQAANEDQDGHDIYKCDLCMVD